MTVDIFGRVIAAFVLVFATAGDDALYLVFYLTSSRFTRAMRIWFGVIFCLVLQSTVWISWGLVHVFGDTLLKSKFEPTEKRIATISACISWSITIFLFIIWCQKHMQMRGKSEQDEHKEKGFKVLPSVRLSTGNLNTNQVSYGTITTPVETANGNGIDHGQVVVDREEKYEYSTFEVSWTVFTLAALGALDELCYFPTLLLSGSFTVIELSIGAFLAAVAMLSALAFCLSMFRPVLTFLDKTPLFVVVSIMSIVMTVDAIRA